VPPPAPAPPADPPALSKMAQACVRVASCTRSSRMGTDARVRDPSACVDWWLSESDPKEPLRKCLADATTCDQVAVCMHGAGDTRAASFCSQKQGVVSGCDGDRLVSCGEDDAHETSVIDCAAMGASCREVKSRVPPQAADPRLPPPGVSLSGGIVVRACWSPQKCPAGAPDSRCDGGAVVSCRDGAFERIACRPGTTCEERPNEAGETTASCELPGRRRCDLRGARYCENDRLIECNSEGHGPSTRVTDCAGFGLRCTGVGPRAGCSVPSNVECDKELLPRCDGGSVSFCAAGRLTKVSCGAIGLGSCDPAAKGSMAGCVTRPSPSAPASSPAPQPPAK
jgi:hypothetical protein